eukprot:Nk52_evm34s24 gene=Nk52_evmTU34s24
MFSFSKNSPENNHMDAPKEEERNKKDTSDDNTKTEGGKTNQGVSSSDTKKETNNNRNPSPSPSTISYPVTCPAASMGLPGSGGGAGDYYSLYVAPQEYLLMSKLAPDQAMTCSRVDYNLFELKEGDLGARLQAIEYAFWGDVFGCLGTLELPSGNYLVLISKAKFVGNLFGHDVFQIRDVLLLPLSIKEDPDWSLCPNRAYWETGGVVEKKESEEGAGDLTISTSPSITTTDQDERNGSDNAGANPPKKFNVKSLKSSLASSIEMFKAKTGIGGGNSSGSNDSLLGSPGPTSSFTSSPKKKKGKRSRRNGAGGANGDAEDAERLEELEEKLMTEFRKILTTGDFYFSHTGDLTLSYLRRAQLSPEEMCKDMWERACDAYFWNKSMCKGMTDAKKNLSSFVVPIIQGFVEISTIAVDSQHDYTFAVISRRSRYRCGTRYRTRGIDEKGHCANSVETEQLVSFKNHITSFVQTRGSVPIFWSQEGWRYRPKPKVEVEKYTQEQFFDAFSLHVVNQFHKYKRQVMINLLDHNNDEDALSRCFEQQIKLFDSADVSYHSFDFHEQCKGMKYENIRILLDEIKDELEEMSYTWISSDGLLVQSQSGVCRVNCMDCLDRTNVVQSAIAKHVYTIQLMRFGMLSPEEGLPKPILDDYNNIWANNGDAISRQYAGTSALKGDFTRTGKRKLQGLAKDGINSLTRYYQSSFKDEYRQLIIDLLLGKVNAEQVIQRYSRQDQKQDNDISYLEIGGSGKDSSSTPSDTGRKKSSDVSVGESILSTAASVLTGGLATKDSSNSDVSSDGEGSATSGDESGSKHRHYSPNELMRKAGVNADKPWNVKHQETFENICELSQNTIVDHNNFFIASFPVVAVNDNGVALDAALILTSDRYNLVQYEFSTGALLCDDIVLMSNIVCVEIGEMIERKNSKHKLALQEGLPLHGSELEPPSELESELKTNKLTREDDNQWCHRVYGIRIYFKVGAGTQHVERAGTLHSSSDRKPSRGKDARRIHRRTSTGEPASGAPSSSSSLISDNNSVMACHTFRHAKVKRFADGKLQMESILQDLISIAEDSDDSKVHFKVMKQCIYGYSGVQIVGTTGTSGSQPHAQDNIDRSETAEGSDIKGSERKGAASNFVDAIGDKFSKLMDKLPGMDEINEESDRFRRSKSASQL